MSRHEAFTTLTVEELTVAGQRLDPANFTPAEVEAFVPPKAPAPLPEKLTMAALAQAHRDLVDTLVTAGLLAPHEGADGAPE
jgi:hypothetical protein